MKFRLFIIRSPIPYARTSNRETEISEFDIRNIKDYSDMDKIEVEDVFGRDKGYRYKDKGISMNGFTSDIQIAAHTDVIIYFVGKASGNNTDAGGVAEINIDGETATFELNGEIHVETLTLQREEGGFYTIEGTFTPAANFFLGIQEKSS